MKSKPVIVVADDNPADRLLAITALRKVNVSNEVKEVEDGEDLMNYLRGTGKYAGAGPDRPIVIFLDINMPKKNGLEALAEIKANPGLRSIPVVMVTTSESESDVLRAYNLGANSFVTKPVNFPDFINMMKQLGNYWLELVKLPSREGNTVTDTAPPAR